MPEEPGDWLPAFRKQYDAQHGPFDFRHIYEVDEELFAYADALIAESKRRLKKVYVLRKRDTNLFLTNYKTNQGNVKKALFNDIKCAQEAIDRYIKRDDLEIVEIGDELVK